MIMNSKGLSKLFNHKTPFDICYFKYVSSLAWKTFLIYTDLLFIAKEFDVYP